MKDCLAAYLSLGALIRTKCNLFKVVSLQHLGDLIACELHHYKYDDYVEFKVFDKREMVTVINHLPNR